MAPLTITVQELDGTWKTLGQDGIAIYPENVRPQATEQGADTFTFQIRRDPKVPSIDLSTWTPCEMYVPNVALPIWEGRIKETPTQDGVDAVVNVSAVGWMQHLEDDVLERAFVHTDMNAWRDIRSFPTAALDRAGTQAGQVGNDAGAITLSWPKGSQVGPGNPYVGVVLDCGPDPTRWAKKLVAQIAVPARTASVGAFNLVFRGADVENVIATTAQETPFTNDVTNYAVGAVFAQQAIFTTPRRFVAVYFYYTAGAVTLGEDTILQLQALRVFTDTNWESGTVPVLRVSDVLADVIPRACPLLAIPTVASAKYADEVASHPRLTRQYRLNEAPGASQAQDSSPYTAANKATVPAFTGQAPGAGVVTGSVGFGGASLLATDPNDPGNASAIFPGGVSDGITIPSLDFRAQNFAIEAVVRCDDLTVNRTIFCAYDSAVTGHIILLRFDTGGSVSLRFWADDLVSAAGIVVVSGVYHVLASYDAQTDTSTIWVNGVQRAQGANGPYISTAAFSAPGSPDTRIGADPQNTAENWKGLIDELNIYMAAPLRQEDATELYQAALARRGGTIERTLFNLQHVFPDGLQTPREYLDAGDKYHRWRRRILPGRQFAYGHQASAVTLRAADSIEFQDAGANSGEDIYTKCVVEGTQGDGTPVRVTRYASQQPQAAGYLTSRGVTQPTNPSADTNTTGWTISGGGSALTRDTSVFDSTPASFKNASGGASNNLSGAFPAGGTFLAGITYELRLRVRRDSTGNNILLFGAPSVSDQVQVTVLNPVANVWQTVTVTWTPKVNRASNLVTIQSIEQVNGVNAWIDSVVVRAPLPTIVDRRGFTRAYVLQATSGPIDPLAGQQLADAFLQLHMRQPFKGSFTAQHGDVFRLPGDVPVAPAELMLMGGEMIRIPRLDPDTQALGRDGRIVTVGYDPDADTANVSLDNDSRNYEALQARMAVVQG